MQVSKTPCLDRGVEAAKRDEIREYFHNTFDIYEQLFECLASEKSYYSRPERLRHPLIFYYGHTAVFFVNKLRVAKIIDTRVNEKIESQLAIGVDEMSWDDLDETNYDWPSVAEVRQYRKKVRDLVDGLIESLPMQLPIDWNDPFWIVLMGIEHERIHIETSSVLIRQLELDEVKDHPNWLICESRGVAPKNDLLPIGAGAAELGRSMPAATFGWDNEFGYQKTDVGAFRASQYLVSNQEFLEFVEEDGYKCNKWWDKEGWAWVQYSRARMPNFWRSTTDGPYKLRTMLQEINMPWNWPAEVNCLEARAFCRWKAAKSGRPLRLPTEPEWYRLRDQHIDTDHPHWHKAPGNINLEYWASPCPIDLFMHDGFGDVLGNVWQWTETTMDGFDGFKVHPAYDDFSVPTFDGRHNLIKGGSWISTGNEATRDARFAFRRHFFQHAGFRYIESTQAVTQESNVYESDELISQYLEFHYGREYFGVKNYPLACIEAIKRLPTPSGFDRALDLGCAVGRSSFELAKHFDYVDGLDFSTRFIRNALRLRETGKIRYLMTDEGELTSLREVKLDDLELGDSVSRVHFSQGDACNLRSIYADYDLIFAGNLIDRLYEPRIFLSSIHERLRPGGLLILTSPYTWLEEYTEKTNWIGGYKENGENLTTYDGLAEVLSSNFEPVGKPQDIPFVIRETARKFQHTIAQMTAWRRKGIF